MGVVWKALISKHGLSWFAKGPKTKRKNAIRNKECGRAPRVRSFAPKNEQMQTPECVQTHMDSRSDTKIENQEEKVPISIQGCIPTCTHACCTGFYLRSLTVALLTWTCCDGAHYVSIFVSWNPPHTHTLYRPTLTGRAKCQTNWSEKSLCVCVKIRHGLGSYSWWDCAAIR